MLEKEPGRPGAHPTVGIWLAVMMTLLTATVPAAAEVQREGQVTLASEYLFRGQSLSEEDPVLQAGFDLSWNSWQLSLWGSTLKLQGRSDVEIDATLTRHLGVVGGTSFAIGIVRYSYLDVSGGDYNEYFLITGWKELSFCLFWTPDLAGDGHDARYWKLSYQKPLATRWALAFHLGYSDFQSSAGLESYWDGSLALTRELGDFELALVASSTDLNDSLAEERVVGQVTIRFD